jgi:RNA polymerase sigma factor (sigma-70 family)
MNDVVLNVPNDIKKANAQSDSELVERCLNGDGSAWVQLLARYQRLVYSVARALCQNQDDVDDVFQSTCLDLYKGLPALRDVKAMPAWLVTVTRRRAISVLEARIHTAVAVEEQQAASVDVIPTIEREHSVERALEQLPQKSRELINLLYFDVNQPSYVAISEKLGIPVASIGPTRARCLDKLRKLLS